MLKTYVIRLTVIARTVSKYPKSTFVKFHRKEKWQVLFVATILGYRDKEDNPYLSATERFSTNRNIVTHKLPYDLPDTNPFGE